MSVVKFAAPGEEDIELAACQWITLLDSGAASNKDISALKVWLRQDERHRAAFEELSADFLRVTDVLSTVGEAVRDLEQKSARSKPKRSKLALSPILAGAACALAAGLMVYTFTTPAAGIFGSTQTAATEPRLIFSSGVGEQEEVTLPDGSILTLNTNSKVEVAYSASERRLHMLQGEAVFYVAADAERPFFVHTDNAIVKALGTIFSVRALSDSVEVMVEEGTVELSSESTLLQASAPTRLSAGSYTEVSSKSGLINTVETDLAYIERRLSWRNGKMRFQNETLENIIAEFSRYSDVKVIIKDAELAELRLGGNFPTEREAFFTTLEQGFDIRVIKHLDNTVELSSAN